MTFDDLNLNNPLRNALQELEYINPTPIQREAFPIIMSGKDVVGVAQTGTGKTFAYLLPLLRMHQFSKEKNPRVLIVVPTRELVVQQVGELEKLTKYMNVRVGGVYGGTNINTQKQVLVDGVDFLVGTPGRLLDLSYTGFFKMKTVKKLVIDEVDEMMNLGFRTQLNALLDLLPERRQNLLFSATLTKEVGALVDTFFNQPQKIEIVPHGTPLDQIIQKGYSVPNFNTKASLLEVLLERDEEMGKVLVFVSTKKLCDKLFDLINEKFPEQIGIIHSNKSQNFRINAVKNFHEGKARVLIATDIIARGIDVREITHVVNFDIPDEPENYIHRIGRTGRADQAGRAISFISEREQTSQEAIEALMNMPIPMEELPEGVIISDQLIDEEKPQLGGDKHYFKAPSIKHSKGAYHEKKDKNKKVNMAQEKRMARLKEKKKAKRKKKK